MKISVIIPAYNEEENIEACLKSVLNNDHKNKEIIVVNDGSNDKTAEKIRKFGSKVKLINNKKNIGIAKSTKKGVDDSKGELIAKIDASCIAGKTWLKEIAKYFSDKKVLAVSGSYTCKKNASLMAETIMNIEDLTSNYLKRFFSVHKLIGTNWMARKSVLVNLDWNKQYEESVLLDIEKKGKIVYDKNIQVRKGKVPDTLKQVWQRKFKWGVNAVKDKYFKNLKFWIRPLYFLIFIFSLIFFNVLLGKLLFLLWIMPLLIIFIFSLFKKPLVSFITPFIFLFSEFAWFCGVINDFLKNEQNN